MISVIVPCYNQHDMTEECLRAVLENTQDCEIIVIDNGSEPPIKPPFSGFIETTVIRNEENKGFPVAVNQGILAAKGETIILLNNDVIVTPGWAEKLVKKLGSRCLADEFGVEYNGQMPVYTGLAIIGPMTNFCAGMQQTAISAYSNIEELNKAAAELSAQNDGEVEEVNFVIGFCMAFPKALYDELGPFDESLWPCSGEEIDFCLRAREAGHRIGIALDVYVHHEGSKTFKAMEHAGTVDYKKICRDCDAHLAEKWGADFWYKQGINAVSPMKVIGDHTYGVENITTYFADEAKLTIGKYCSIGPDIKIYLGGEHRTDWLTTFPFSHFFPEIEGNYRISKGDVTIGNDVWIGHGVTILSGVTIGDGAVIGAGAVVASDVEPYSIVVGNPAQHKRYKVNPGLKWWDWPEDIVYEAIPILQSGDVEGLKRFADERGLA